MQFGMIEAPIFDCRSNFAAGDCKVFIKILSDQTAKPFLKSLHKNLGMGVV